MNLKERNLNNKDFFSQKVDSYDKVHETLMETKKDAIDALNIDTVRVLDLGAGTGLELIYLFKRFPNAKVTAIDITPEMLAKIKERDFSHKVNAVCGDFFEVDFSKDFDAVVSTSALHHFTKEDKFRLYKKIFECLKDNGQFINSDRFVDTKKQEDEFSDFYEKNYNKVAHCDTPLSIDTETEILRKVGFKNIEFVNSKTSKDYKLLKCRK